MNYAIPKTMAFLTLSAGIVSCSQNAVEVTRPNIILIMSDDAGYSDVGCFGSEISTPNIDKLGYNGIRFSVFIPGPDVNLPAPRFLRVFKRAVNVL